MNAKPTLKIAVLVQLFVLLVACSQEEKTHTAPPQPTVSVAPVVHETVTEWKEFSGRLAAPETVELRPRVSGHIEKVFFKDGEIVEQGSLLLQIDAEPFKARVQQLEAELENAQSRLTLATTELQRAKRLIEKNAISRESLDTRLAEHRQASAQTKSAQSSLKLASLDLAYTRIKAPISGRVSNAYQTQGNFVTAGQSVLTEIVSTDKLYAYFDADERSYLAYRKAEQQGLVPNNRSGDAPVFMALSGESDYGYEGEIDFIDNKVNESTGTIKMRAVFENKQNLLLPGLFARLRVVGSESYPAILIQDKAIGTDLDKKFVLVLAEDNTVQYRAVTPGKKIGGLRVITSGLEPSDQIVVNGLQRVRPGSSVQVESVSMTTPAEIAQLQALQKRIDTLTQQSRVAEIQTNSTHAITKTL